MLFQRILTPIKLLLLCNDYNNIMRLIEVHGVGIGVRDVYIQRPLSERIKEEFFKEKTFKTIKLKL